MFYMISPLEKPNEDCCKDIWTCNGEPDLVVSHPDEGEDVVLLGELLHEDGEAVFFTDYRDAEVNIKCSFSLVFYSRPTDVRFPLKEELWQKLTLYSVLSYLLISSFIKPSHVSSECFIPKSSTTSSVYSQLFLKYMHEQIISFDQTFTY